MPHEITVAELAEVLTKLRPGDLLFPNQVGTLTIVREGRMIGFISLLLGKPMGERVEMFDDEANDDHANAP